MGKFKSILTTILLISTSLSASPVFDMLDDFDVTYRHSLKSRGNLLGLYNPNNDVIYLRKRSAYFDEAYMNHTVLHELGHWARDDRRLGPPGGDNEPDWVEEIVVELSAAVVADELECKRCCACQMQKFIDQELGNSQLCKRRKQIIIDEVKKTAEYLLKRPLSENAADTVLASVGFSQGSEDIASR